MVVCRYGEYFAFTREVQLCTSPKPSSSSLQPLSSHPPPSLSHTLFLRLSATIKWTTQSFQEIHRERGKLLHRQFFLSISNFYLKTFDLFRIFACTTFPSFSIIERRYLRNLSVQSTSAYVLVGLSFSRFLRHRYQLHDNMYAVEQLAMRSAAHTPAQNKTQTHTHTLNMIMKFFHD